MLPQFFQLFPHTATPYQTVRSQSLRIDIRSSMTSLSMPRSGNTLVVSSFFFFPNNPTLNLNESWMVLRQYQRLVFIKPPLNEYKAALRKLFSSFSLRGHTNLIQMRGLRSPTSSCSTQTGGFSVSRKKTSLEKTLHCYTEQGK